MPITMVSGFFSPIFIRMKALGKVSFSHVYYASVIDLSLHGHALSCRIALSYGYYYWHCFQIGFLASVLISAH